MESVLERVLRPWSSVGHGKQHVNSFQRGAGSNWYPSALVLAFPGAELLFIWSILNMEQLTVALLIVPLKFIVRVERFLTKLIFLEQNHATKVFTSAVRLRRD